jgi:hypothetical protein
MRTCYLTDTFVNWCVDLQESANYVYYVYYLRIQRESKFVAQVFLRTLWALYPVLTLPTMLLE